MNKLEQLHLDAIANEFYISTQHSYEVIANKDKAAKVCSEITEQIAIEFAEWILQEDHLVWSTSKKELFQMFLKTKQ